MRLEPATQKKKKSFKNTNALLRTLGDVHDTGSAAFGGGGDCDFRLVKSAANCGGGGGGSCVTATGLAECVEMAADVPGRGVEATMGLLLKSSPKKSTSSVLATTAADDDKDKMTADDETAVSFTVGVSGHGNDASAVVAAITGDNRPGAAITGAGSCL
jgi:hypothetical protein